MSRNIRNLTNRLTACIILSKYPEQEVRFMITRAPPSDYGRNLINVNLLCTASLASGTGAL